MSIETVDLYFGDAEAESEISKLAGELQSLDLTDNDAKNLARLLYWLPKKKTAVEGLSYEAFTVTAIACVKQYGSTSDILSQIQKFYTEGKPLAHAFRLSMIAIWY